MMSLFFSFFCLFSSLALLSAVLVVASKNPVYSVLFLILSFCNVSALLFLLNLEFLPITFLVVYVGAIAVLFLFVLMMLNIKITEMKAENVHFLPVATLLAIVFILEIFVLMRLEFLPLTFSFVHAPFVSDFANYNISFLESSLFYLNESNMRSLGQILFVEY
jgi:NADH:ubiquinone oxidoreductase subunit 6 (subunit J)